MLTAMDALAITLNAKYNNQLDTVLREIQDRANNEYYHWYTECVLEKEVISYLTKLGYYCRMDKYDDGKIYTVVNWE